MNFFANQIPYDPATPLLSIYSEKMRASHVVQWWKIHLQRQESQETWFQFLVLEEPVEEGMATHSTILTWRIP